MVCNGVHFTFMAWMLVSNKRSPWHIYADTTERCRTYNVHAMDCWVPIIDSWYDHRLARIKSVLQTRWNKGMSSGSEAIWPENKSMFSLGVTFQCLSDLFMNYSRRWQELYKIINSHARVSIGGLTGVIQELTWIVDLHIDENL